MVFDDDWECCWVTDVVVSMMIRQMREVQGGRIGRRDGEELCILT